MIRGELTEIAGTGLRVEADIDVEPGQRVLVALKFGDEDVVEALGKVRRAGKDEEGLSVLIVELVGLTHDEIAKLALETNAAARENAGRGVERDLPARPAAAGSMEQEG